MALQLYLSNSLETLADKFAENFSMKGRDPFETLCAVVPNSGMGTFLKRHLARKSEMGIAANIEAPFLQKFITDHICLYLSSEMQESFRTSLRLWSPEILSWRIDALLGLFPDEFPDYTAYWSGDASRRHALACELAGNFDRYQLYRSSVTGNTQLKGWRSREAESSLEKLYFKLNAAFPDPDTYFEIFFKQESPLTPLPERVGVFGIGTMPALYFKCLKKFSESTCVHLFCPSPCQTYWGDLLSRKELLKELKNDSDRSYELLEERAGTNQILADFGVPGREFFNLLLSEGCFTGADSEESFIEPGEGTALQLFQSDILNARARNEANGNKVDTPASDNSVRINCCSDSKRELEILHDQLLELFYAKDEKSKGRKEVKVTDELRMEDVIVMFPDINKAAPMIDAVFSNGPFKGQYAICDRSSAGQSQVIECFNCLLDLPSGRMTSEDILELLDFGCINSKLDIPVEELNSLTDLIVRARVCWGLDENDHQRFRGADFKEFSWQDGIDRILTEYARGEDLSRVNATDESGGIDGGDAENFARLARFIGKLKEWRTQLPLPRTASQWAEFMRQWIDTFFSGGSKEYLPEINELRRAAAKIASNAQTAFGEEELAIDSAVFVSRLKSECSLTGGKQHFLRDKITFCSLVPLRAVPAKVIAVLGLNDGEFPGIDRHNSFDLLATIMRGDPNLSNDGRYLFLEALMAAREHLILSYVGFDNGEELAPAVPMGTVENILKEGFSIKKTNIPLKALALDTLKELYRPEEETPDREIPDLPPLALPETMSIRTLQQLLTAHCREFFKLRCGFDIQKYTQRAPFVDDPETLDPMDESALLKALWNLSRADIPEDKWYSLVNRCRLLPVNDTVVFNTSKAIILELRQKFSEHIPSLLASCRAELACGTALCGELGVPEGFESSKERTVIHFSKFAHEKLLSFYLEQLLLAVHFGMPVAGTVVFSKEPPPSNVFKFWTVPDIQRLDELVSIALRAYTEPRPLPIFNSASFAEARNSNGYKMIRDDISSCKATALFYNMDNIPREEFKELANQIFFPIANMNGDA